MGFMVVGVGSFGLSIMFLLVTIGIFSDEDGKELYDPYAYGAQLISGFGFGASSIALFARVAGGIYTKAADVGADLVGKVEAGIDEDDPHNPAVIADNVGDNVGDVAGMGADLFESYVGSIIACIYLASKAASQQSRLTEIMDRDGGFTCDKDSGTCDYDKVVPQLVALPFWLVGNGIICSLIGCLFVSTKEKGDGWNVKLSSLMWALERGMYVAAFLFILCAMYCVILLFGPESELGWRLFACICIGLFAGVGIGKMTEYFTSFDFGPVKSIKDRGLTGPATVIIQGLGVGMISCVPPTIILVVTILACDALATEYGVSIAAVGMLATLGITLATDAYGPVADNAGGLAELCGLESSVREKTDSLDALGNTTAATGKGFAIGSAVLTSLSLLVAFQTGVTGDNSTLIKSAKDNDAYGFSNDEIRLAAQLGYPKPELDGAGEEIGEDFKNFDVSSPTVLAGILFGAVLPLLFGALTMISVGKAAAEIIIEVRRQFKEQKNAHGTTLLQSIQWCTEHPGEECPDEFEVEPDSNRCVKISTESSVREMIAPGAYAILSPLIIGFFVGPKMLLGVLAGAIATGAMMAIMMSNAGGAWDNGKKLCEKLKLKRTDQGKACVVGDTVGDPFKDTSGPSLNILIKLMSMVSLVIAPLIQRNDTWDDFYWGFVPLGLIIIISFLLVWYKILSWEDPLGKHVENPEPSASPASDNAKPAADPAPAAAEAKASS